MNKFYGGCKIINEYGIKTICGSPTLTVSPTYRPLILLPKPWPHKCFEQKILVDPIGQDLRPGYSEEEKKYYDEVKGSGTITPHKIILKNPGYTMYNDPDDDHKYPNYCNNLKGKIKMWFIMPPGSKRKVRVQVMSQVSMSPLTGLMGSSSGSCDVYVNAMTNMSILKRGNDTSGDAITHYGIIKYPNQPLYETGETFQKAVLQLNYYYTSCELEFLLASYCVVENMSVNLRFLEDDEKVK